ncbi:MAG: hypothetical protein RIS76_2225 [Verrucomicrobiota bacterium]
MPSRYHLPSHGERSRMINLPQFIAHLTMTVQKAVMDYAAAAI